MAFNGLVTNQTAITRASIGRDLSRAVQVRADRSEPPALNPSAPVLRLRYSPSIERRAANLARFVEKSRAFDPQGAAALGQLIASTDLIAALGQALAPIGLRTDDVADAYTVWWVSAWQAAHGDASTPSRAKAQAVRASGLHLDAMTLTEAGFVPAG